MQKEMLLDRLAESPVIAAIQESGWNDAIASPAKIIFCLKANLLTVKEYIEKAHESGKIVFIHIDLSDGIGKDKIGVEFLAKCGVDGIISTRGNMVRIAKDIVHSRNQNPDIKNLVKGLMIESYIEDGACKAEEHIFGKSITDPCLGWEKTERLILDIADKL